MDWRNPVPILGALMKNAEQLMTLGKNGERHALVSMLRPRRAVFRISSAVLELQSKPDRTWSTRVPG